MLHPEGTKMAKRFCKRLLSCLLCIAGKFPTPSAVRDFISRRIVPLLLSPDILPAVLSPRPLHGYEHAILCNPYLYVHRAPYFFGVLYETHLQRYVENHVHAGDTVIDVGCNAGHVTIPAAEHVGKDGCVLSFEPNKDLVRAVGEHVDRLGLSQVKMYPFALGSERKQATMEKSGEHTGGGTLCTDRFDGNCSDVESAVVEVRRGDVVLGGADMPGSVFLKIDVEGFEKEVLNGMPELLLKKVDHAVIEVTPEWIGGQPAVAHLFRTMQEFGFRAFNILGNGSVGGPLQAEDVNMQTDVLFRKD